MVYSKKRYFDNLAKAHIIDGETGGDQGDPLESCAYSLSTLHLIGAVMARHPNAVAAAVIDDLTLKGPLSEVMKIFAEIKHVLHEDAGLELAVKKTQILSKDMSLDQFKERATKFIQRDPSLEPCLPLLDSEDDHEVFTVTGFKGLGVPIGTPDFITRFVAHPRMGETTLITSSLALGFRSKVGSPPHPTGGYDGKADAPCGVCVCV